MVSINNNNIVEITTAATDATTTAATAATTVATDATTTAATAATTTINWSVSKAMAYANALKEDSNLSEEDFENGYKEK